MISSVGLVLIILAWLIQFISKEKVMKKEFLILYCLGVVALSVDAFLSGISLLAILQLVSSVSAFAVFVGVRKQL